MSYFGSSFSFLNLPFGSGAVHTPRSDPESSILLQQYKNIYSEKQKKNKNMEKKQKKNIKQKKNTKKILSDEIECSSDASEDPSCDISTEESKEAANDWFSRFFPSGWSFPTLNIPVNHKIDPETRVFMSEFRDQFFSEACDFSSKVTGNVASKFSPLVVSYMALSLLTAIFLVRGDYKKALATTTLLGFFGITDEVLSAYIARFQDVCNDFESQSVVEGDDAIITIALSILLYLTTGRRPHKSFPISIIEMITNLGRTKKSFVEGLTSLTDVLAKVFKSFDCDYLSDLFTSNDDTFIKGVSKWIDDVTKVVKRAHAGELSIDRANYNHLQSLYMRGRELQTRIADKDLQLKVRNLVQPHFQALNKLWAPFEQACFGDNQFKVEPLAVVLTGLPGVGKSMCTIPLLGEVMVQVLPKDLAIDFVDKPMDHIYCRKNEHKYWDGYHGQFATIFDDFGQSVDFAQNSESEYMDIIRVVNAFPHICHMASLEAKGSTEFTSDIVLATTNMTTLQSKSVLEPSAIMRRFDATYWVAPKKEFSVSGGNPMVRKLDRTKLPTDEFGDVIPFSSNIYEFFPYSFDGGKILGPPISYDELVKQLVNTYRCKFARGDKVNSFIKDRLREKLEERVCFPQAYNEDILSQLMSDKSSSPIEELASLLASSEGNVHNDPPWFWARLIEFIISVFKITTGKCVSFSTKQWHNLRNKLPTTELWRDFLCSQWTDLPSFEDLYELGRKTLQFLRNFLFSYKKILTTVIGLLGGLLAGKKIYDLVFADQSEPQLKNETETQLRVKPLRRCSLEAQAGDKQVQDIASGIVSKNMFEIVRRSDSHAIGHILFLDAQYAVLPYHYINTFKRSLDFEKSRAPERCGLLLCNDITGEDIPLSYAEILDNVVTSHQELDLAFITYPGRVRKFRNIRSRFSTGDEVIPSSWLSGTLVYVNDNAVLSHNTNIIMEKDFHVGRSWGGYTVERGYGYNLATQNGDCGALLFSTSPGDIHGKIIGMHIAGNHVSYGFSTAINQKLFPPLLKEDCDPQYFSGFHDLGRAPVPVHLPRTTKISRSMLYGLYGPVMRAPALLCPKDGIEPWSLATSKYAYEPIKIPMDFYDDIDSVFKEITRLGAPTHDEYLVTLNFDEAVLGVPHLPYVEPIPRNTSPGYPFSLNARGKGKTMWFGSGNDYDLDNPHCHELRCRIIKQLEQLKTSRVDFYYTDFLKDEVRPIERVRAGRTRLVSGCPLDLSILTRMYYAGFAGWFMANRITNGSAVGCNVFSAEWPLIYEHLRLRDNVAIAGDFSNFDGSLRAEVLRHIGARIDKWYGDEHNPVRKHIWAEVYSSKHVQLHLMYQFMQGLPSGHPLTSVINSIYNLSAIRYSVRRWCADHGKQFIPESYRCIVYGDDNIISFNRILFSDLQPNDLVQYFAELGLRYGPVSKDNSLLEFTPAHELTFLKRSFYVNVDTGTLVAPLSLDTVLDMVNWTKKGSRSIEIVLDKIDNVYKELSLHGKEVFEKYAKPLTIKSRQCYKYVSAFTEYDDALDAIVNSDSRW